MLNFVSPFLISGATLLRSRTLPANIILANLADKADALQHVRDIVDSTFLHVQGLHGFVQIKDLAISFFEKINELFSQLDQAVLLPASFIASWAIAIKFTGVQRLVLR